MIFQKNHNLRWAWQHPDNERGISVLLAILILSSLTIMTIAISDVVLRVGRSSRQIGQSEIAYYAAETAVERALYYIEQQRTVTIPDGGSGSLSDITGASWTRQVVSLNRLLVKCGSGEDELPNTAEGVCVEKDVNEDIGPSNPLKVQLNPGHSFQLDLNFSDLPLANNLRVDWGGNGKLIASGIINGQHIYSSSETLQDLASEKYLIRLINEGSNLITFTLKPADVGLPVGILVTSTGTYQNEQRVLEVERKNWQIY